MIPSGLKEELPKYLYFSPWNVESTTESDLRCAGNRSVLNYCADEKRPKEGENQKKETELEEREKETGLGLESVT